MQISVIAEAPRPFDINQWKQAVLVSDQDTLSEASLSEKRKFNAPNTQSVEALLNEIERDVRERKRQLN